MPNRFWLVALKIFSSVLILILVAVFSRERSSNTFWMFFAAAPLVVVVLSPKKWWGFSGAIAFGFLCAIIPFFGPDALEGVQLLFLGFGAQFLLLLPLAIPALIGSLGFVVSAIACWVSSVRKRQKRTGLTLLGAVVYTFGILTFGFDLPGYLYQYLLPDHPHWPATSRTVVPCAWAYAHDHHEEFPATLKEIGPEGTGCLGPDLSHRGYVVIHSVPLKLKYAPRRDNAGRRMGFDLVVIYKLNQGIGIDSFFTDESGMVRYARDRQATAHDPPANTYESFFLYQIRNDFRRFRKVCGTFPPDLSVASRYNVASEQLCEYRIPTPPEVGAAEVYRPQVDSTGKIATFTFSECSNHDLSGDPDMPIYYRKFRNFFMDESLVVRATADNRCATSTDPVALEYQ